MPTLKLMRLLGSAALLAGTSAVATAQTQSEPRPPTPPSITTPAPSPNPATGPSRDKPAKTHELVGLAVLSSDGSRVGTVHKVAADPDGRVTAIQVKAGGFLGFGGRLVIVPEGKFARKGESIQLAMTADEVSKLPETKEQS